MKRLFTVGYRKNQKFFDKKEKAKEYRDALNNNKDGTFCVSRGPDHMGKHGSTVPSKMRRKPSHCS